MKAFYNENAFAPTSGLSQPFLSHSCRHLGSEVRLAACPSCAGNVKIKVFTCAIFGEATVERKIGSLACCKICDRYGPREQATLGCSHERPRGRP